MKKSNSKFRILIRLTLLAISLGMLSVPILRLVHASRRLVIEPQSSNEGFVAQELEENLARERCFFNPETQNYCVPNVPFGSNLEEMISGLGLQDFYVEERMRDAQNGLKSEALLKGLGDNITISAFDATYNIHYYFANNEGFCGIKLGAGIFTTDNNPKGLFLENNVMTYRMACDNFYQVYRQFLEEYQEPTFQDVSTDLYTLTVEDILTTKEDARVYACWVAGEHGDRTTLSLEARVYETYDAENTPSLYLYINIEVGQEMNDVTSEKYFGQIGEQT